MLRSTDTRIDFNITQWDEASTDNVLCLTSTGNRRKYRSVNKQKVISLKQQVSRKTNKGNRLRTAKFPYINALKGTIFISSVYGRKFNIPMRAW
jgi:hypothetical protein